MHIEFPQPVSPVPYRSGQTAKTKLIRCCTAAMLLCGCFVSVLPAADKPDWVEVSVDKTHFVKRGTSESVLLWGVNYDRDTKMRLMDDYWISEWDTVAKDFDEMKALGVNVVRIHLQFGRFMKSPSQPDAESLKQLFKLIRAAEERGLYLYVTGLACYKKSNIPAWYDAMNEKDRWAAQSVFWKHVAKTCAPSSAVFCYDLMNEPVVPGGQTGDWLPPEGLGDMFYVQKITRTPDGRTSHEIAKAWVDCLTAAIRSEDKRHLITVGVIPWAAVWQDAKPLFYDPVVAENLDFVSVHFYPKGGKIGETLQALKVYAIGKPLVIAEMFPLHCSIEEMDQFIAGSKPLSQGWISFYWGKTIEEYARTPSPSIADDTMKKWLEYLQSHSTAKNTDAGRTNRKIRKLKLKRKQKTVLQAEFTGRFYCAGGNAGIMKSRVEKFLRK
ncbi:MAG: glycoside hydrolase family 5 protein [Planctomycetaceae bacterium]|jgi:hypothetical protein|nr:glycoside hydrolase family 5 protein [Planctomycetaceae bacterium]